MSSEMNRIKRSISEELSQESAFFDIASSPQKKGRLEQLVQKFIQEADNFAGDRFSSIEHLVQEVHTMLEAGGATNSAEKVNKFIQDSKKRKNEQFTENSSKRVKTGFSLFNEELADLQAVLANKGYKEEFYKIALSILEEIPLQNRPEVLFYLEKIIPESLAKDHYTRLLLNIAQYFVQDKKALLDELYPLFVKEDDIDDVIHVLEGFIEKDRQIVDLYISAFNKCVEGVERGDMCLKEIAFKILSMNRKALSHVPERISQVKELSEKQTLKTIGDLLNIVPALGTKNWMNFLLIAKKYCQQEESPLPVMDLLIMFQRHRWPYDNLHKALAWMDRLESQWQHKFSVENLNEILPIIAQMVDQQDDVIFEKALPLIEANWNAISVKIFLEFTGFEFEQDNILEEAIQYIAKGMQKNQDATNHLMICLFEMQAEKKLSFIEMMPLFRQGLAWIDEEKGHLVQGMRIFPKLSYAIVQIIEMLEIFTEYKQENIYTILEQIHLIKEKYLDLSEVKALVEELIACPIDTRGVITAHVKDLLYFGNVTPITFTVQVIKKKIQGGIFVGDICNNIFHLVGVNTKDSRIVFFILNFIQNHSDSYLTKIMGLMAKFFSIHTGKETKEFMELIGSKTETETDDICQAILGTEVVFSWEEFLSLFELLGGMYPPARSAVIEEGSKFLNMAFNAQELKSIWFLLGAVPRQSLAGIGNLVDLIPDRTPSGYQEFLDYILAVPLEKREAMIKTASEIYGNEKCILSFSSILFILYKSSCILNTYDIWNKVSSLIEGSQDAHSLLALVVGVGFAIKAGREELANSTDKGPLQFFVGVVDNILEQMGEGAKQFLREQQSIYLMREDLGVLLELQENGIDLTRASYNQIKAAVHTFFYIQIEEMLKDPHSVHRLRDLIGRLETKRSGLGMHQETMLGQAIVLAQTRVDPGVICSHSSIYEVDLETQEKREKVVDLQKIPFEGEGEIGFCKVNLQKIISQKEPPPKVTFAELRAMYPESNYAALQQIFQQCKQRIANLGEEQKQRAIQEIAGFKTETMMGPDEEVLNFHEYNCLGLGQRIRYWLLQNEQDDESAPILAQGIYALVDNVIKGSPELSEGSALTEQEERLLKLSFSVAACHTGQDAGIFAAYRDLSRTDRASVEDFVQADAIDKVVINAIKEEISHLEDLLSNQEPLLAEIVSEGGLNQLTHQSLYVKNILVNSLKLEHTITFDEYGSCVDPSLRNASQQDLLESVVGHLLPKIVKNLKKEIEIILAKMMTGDEESTTFYNTLYAYLENHTSEDIFLYDEQKGIMQITDKGVFTLLEQQGYIKLLNDQV